LRNLFFKNIQKIFSEKFFCINIENADSRAVVIKKKKERKFEKRYRISKKLIEKMCQEFNM
jgi:hypothetical protein